MNNKINSQKMYSKKIEAIEEEIEYIIRYFKPQAHSRVLNNKALRKQVTVNEEKLREKAYQAKIQKFADRQRAQGQLDEMEIEKQMNDKMKSYIRVRNTKRTTE